MPKGALSRPGNVLRRLLSARRVFFEGFCDAVRDAAENSRRSFENAPRRIDLKIRSDHHARSRYRQIA